MQQLDIFADSAPVQRANDLIAALTNFDRAASRNALHRLTETDPQHAGLAQYHLLCDFVEGWADNCDDPDWSPTLPQRNN